MKHINQLLLELVNDTEAKIIAHERARRNREAAKRGIAEARRILGIEPKPQEQAA